MSLWERDYMHERWRKMHAGYKPNRYGESEAPLNRPSRAPADPPWLKIIAWLCVATVVVALVVREHERRKPKPPKRVVSRPVVAEPEQEHEQPAKPFDFFRQAPREPVSEGR